jgi:hypothetical protein
LRILQERGEVIARRQGHEQKREQRNAQQERDHVQQPLEKIGPHRDNVRQRGKNPARLASEFVNNQATKKRRIVENIRLGYFVPELCKFLKSKCSA